MKDAVDDGLYEVGKKGDKRDYKTAVLRMTADGGAYDGWREPK